MDPRSTPLPVVIAGAVLLATVLVVGGAAPTAGEAAVAADEGLVESCAEQPPEDFADPEDGNETIGWFDGYWYDEPLDIDADDGITQAELEALSARTAARFEALRCLAFEELPPIEIQSREAFAGETDDLYGETGDDYRQFDNAMLETLLLVGPETDSIDVRVENQGAVVGGYYDIEAERIVVVSDDTETLLIDEAILAHELGHALQDHHFDVSRYDRTLGDRNAATLGVIEGDVHRIEQTYLDHCEEGRWNEPCLTGSDAQSDAGASGEPSNWGLYFMQFQPYSDGPSFVDHVYEDGGWEAVDALYDEMPRSSHEIITPEAYGEFEPESLDVPDESNDDWNRLTVESGPDHQVIGQAGLSAIFMDAAYDPVPAEIIAPQDFLNLDGQDIDATDPLDYDQPETDGWRGDELHVYHDGDGETGTVWKLAWADDEEAGDFLDAYEQLIEHRGGERVEGYEHTYEFGADSEFEKAVTIYPDGDRLWIVTAPTVDELTAVHGGVELVEAVGEEDGSEDGTASEDGDDTIPGFGLTPALVALAALTLVHRRR